MASFKPYSPETMTANGAQGLISVSTPDHAEQAAEAPKPKFRKFVVTEQPQASPKPAAPRTENVDLSDLVIVPGVEVVLNKSKDGSFGTTLPFAVRRSDGVYCGRIHKQGRVLYRPEQLTFIDRKSRQPLTEQALKKLVEQALAKKPKSKKPRTTSQKTE